MKTDKNILIAFLLNLLFSIFEFVGGVFTNSYAIISDALHDFIDCISIGISFVLERVSKKKPNNIYTYGYLRYSIMGSFITSGALLIGSIIVLINAVKRLFIPVNINYNGMIIFALIGTIINLLAVYFTKEGDSLNQKAVNLHMLEDVLGWIIVLVGSIIMKFTNIVLIDALMSVGVSIFIIINVLKNFKKISDLFLEKTPRGIDIDEIQEELLKIMDIDDIHHVHIWSLDGINNYATMHVKTGVDSKKIKQAVRKILKRYNINHVTIEVEGMNEKCLDEMCNIKDEYHHKY